MEEEKEVYIIDGKDYTVITKTKENSSNEAIYNILVNLSILLFINKFLTNNYTYINNYIFYIINYIY